MPPSKSGVTHAGLTGSDAPAANLWNAMGIMLQRQEAGEGIVRLPRGAPFGLSSAQERLWWLYQADPDATYFNIPLAWKIAGQIDEVLLRQAIHELALRHEVLRTSFLSFKGQLRAVVSPVSALELAVEDFSTNPEGLMPRAAEIYRKPFDPGQDPLARVTLFKLGKNASLLLFTVHQIVFDGASIRIIGRDLAEIYKALASERQSRLPALPIQYADFAHWQNNNLEGTAFTGARAYWAEQTAAPYAPLQLPLDHPRPAAIRAAPSGKHAFQFSRALMDRLAEAGRRQGTTVFAVLIAGLSALLSRYTGQDDLIVFASLSGRTRPELRNIVGLIANVVPLRISTAGDPALGDLAARVRTAVLGGFANQDYPFERIVEMLAVTGPGRSIPPGQVMVTYQNAFAADLDMGAGVRLSSCEVLDNGEARFELLIDLIDTAAGLHGSVKYRAELFSAMTISKLIADYETVLEAVAGAPAARLSELGVQPAAGSVYCEPTGCRSTQTGQRDFTPPRDELETQLVKLWQEILRMEPVGIHDDFFALGGTSLMAARLFSKMERLTGQRLRLAALIEASTVARLAALLRESSRVENSSMVLLEQGTGRPLFFVPGVGGRVLELRPLASHLQGHPFYAFEARELDEIEEGRLRIEAIASQYVAELRLIQPTGPYLLGGLCFGAFVALEMANQLEKAGAQVSFLIALDPPPPPGRTHLRWQLARALLRTHLHRLRHWGAGKVIRYAANTAKSQAVYAYYRVVGGIQRLVYRLFFVRASSRKLLENPAMNRIRNRLGKVARYDAVLEYFPHTYSGDLIVIQAERNGMMKNLTAEDGWRGLIGGEMELHVVAGGHTEFFHEPLVPATAGHVQRFIDQRAG